MPSVILLHLQNILQLHSTQPAEVIYDLLLLNLHRPIPFDFFEYPLFPIPMSAGNCGDSGKSVPLLRIMVSTVFTLDTAILTRTPFLSGSDLSISIYSNSESFHIVSESSLSYHYCLLLLQ